MPETCAPATPPEDTLRVLVVEDRVADVELSVAELRRAGMHVLAERVQTREEFLRAVEGAAYDVVLADYTLPGWVGTEALAELRRRGLDTPLILVTGTIGEEQAVEWVKQGVSDYVLKDGLRRLPVAVRRALAEAQQRREQQDAWAAVERSEREYRMLFEQANVAMLIFEPDSEEILEANPEACSLYGMPRRELVGHSLKQLTRDVAAGERQIQDLLATGETRDFESVHRRAEGSELFLLISSRVIDYRGRTAILSVQRDLTYRRRVEREREALLRQLTERVKELTTLGRVAQLLYGPEKPTEELLAELAAALPAGWQYPANTEVRIWAAGTAAATPGFRRTGWMQREHGTAEGCAFGIEVAYLEEQPEEDEGPFFREERALLRAVADMLRSYLGRRRAQEALRASEERYRTLFDNAYDVIYTHDMQGNITSLNRAGEVLTGYRREEIVQMNVLQLVAPEQRDTARALLERGTVTSPGQEFTIVTKTGKRVLIEVNEQLLYEDGAVVAVGGIGRDVTERKRLEAELQQAQKMEAVGRLAGGVAHDFNNLLMVIHGYAELALEQLAPRSPSRQPLGEIRKAAERAATLTRQLLAFSRRQVMQPEVIRLNDTVTVMARMLARVIGEDVELCTRLAPEIGSVRADPGQLEQVLMNLAVNARDAMPRGGRFELATSAVQVGESNAAAYPGVPPGDYVLLSARDTGTGIAPEVREHIFEPFFTTKPKEKGTGLGLATVYGIVKQSGGYVTVESALGAGAEFRVYLPRYVAPAHALPQPEAAQERPRGSETILLVEDETGVRELVAAMLRGNGYAVVEASDGEEALRMAAEHGTPLDLLISDVVMPRMSGGELASRLQAEHPGLRVLLLSGYTDDTVLRHGIEQASVPFLQKPFRSSELASKVREVLREEPAELRRTA